VHAEGMCVLRACASSHAGPCLSLCAHSSVFASSPALDPLPPFLPSMNDPADTPEHARRVQQVHGHALSPGPSSFLYLTLQISLNTRDVFIECTATDLTKAKVVLNTMVCMFSEYCSKPFEVEPVEVVDVTGEAMGACSLGSDSGSACVFGCVYACACVCVYVCVQWVCASVCACAMCIGAS